MDTQVRLWEGQSLELLTSNKEIFYTQLMNCDETLAVRRPVNNKDIQMEIENGMPVAVYFHDELEGLHVFISKIYILPSGTIIIDKPSNETIKKAQRRRFFRVQASVDVQLFIPKIEETDKEKEVKVLTHDLSGGGLSFLLREKIIKKGEVVQGFLLIHTRQKSLKIKFTGEIVRVMQQENTFYKHSLQFIDMSESVRSDIIHYCMMKQVEIHKKVRGVD